MDGMLSFYQYNPKFTHWTVNLCYLTNAKVSCPILMATYTFKVNTEITQIDR